MKRKKTYKADEIILKSCKYLIKKRIDTASNIAKNININPKTAQKYLGMGVNLGILIADELYESKDGRHCIAYWINPNYLEIFNKLKVKHDEK